MSDGCNYESLRPPKQTLKYEAKDFHSAPEAMKRLLHGLYKDVVNPSWRIATVEGEESCLAIRVVQRVPEQQNKQSQKSPPLSPDFLNPNSVAGVGYDTGTNIWLIDPTFIDPHLALTNFHVQDYAIANYYHWFKNRRIGRPQHMYCIAIADIRIPLVDIDTSLSVLGDQIDKESERVEAACKPLRELHMRYSRLASYRQQNPLPLWEK